MVIDDECIDLVDGFTHGYTQDPKRHMDGADDDLTPYKDGFYEHLMDARRYICICRRHTGRSRKPGSRKIPAGFNTMEGWKFQERFDPYGREMLPFSTDETPAVEETRNAHYSFGEE